ncbi:MAG: methyltransferase domain-containing protein [Desulfobacteraceae bacterium]|nr:methyltransferase domain-containing protein [Desulfobacteraceae bacterium]
MKSKKIQDKFGDNYVADERTFIMGIDQRFTNHFAERFKNLTVLETCTGAGFTTISLAKTAKHIFTVDIDQSHQDKAIRNIQKAGLSSKVSFISGSILDPELLREIPSVDAVFIDPDWAVTGPDHIYRFIKSNTQPPADIVLRNMFEISDNVAIVLPPFIAVKEFKNLPEHECEKLYLGENQELFCLYFGKLIRAFNMTEFYAKI